MTYQDRLKEAAYISPKGERFTFIYEDLSRSFDKKTTVFEFPDAPGTFVQDLGRTGNRYPMRFIFAGADYDLEATAFEKALAEVGIGTLEHPVYGVNRCVVVGEVERTDPLKSAGGQAIITCQLFQSNELLFPEAQTDPTTETLDAIDAANTAAPDVLVEELAGSTTSALVVVRDRYTTLKGQVDQKLAVIAEQQADVQRRFLAVSDSINGGIDTFVRDPITLARQAQILSQLPARSGALISDRLAAYVDLISTLAVVRVPGAEGTNVGLFAIDDLYSGAFMMGAVLSTLENQFNTQPEALLAADELLAILEERTTWRDANFASLGIIDEGTAWQHWRQAMVSAAGRLVEISFSLKQERSLITTWPRSPLELLSELYESVSETDLDFFITSNELESLELLEVPAGRRIVYYV